jgi:TolB-like protein
LQSIVAILCLLFLTTLVHAMDGKELFAVLDLQSDGSVTPATIDTVCERIGATVAKDKRFEVFDRKFLPFTLQNIGMPEHPRCSQIKCLADIGKSIGAKYIIGGTIKVINKVLFITLNHVDAENGILLGTVTKKVTATRSEFVNQKLPPLVRELVHLQSQKSTIAQETATAGKSQEIDKKSKLPPKEHPFASAIAQDQTENLSDNNKKPRETENKLHAAATKKKKSPAAPIAIISASAVVVGVAVVVYLKFFNGPGAQGDNELSLDDAPNHVK